MTVRWSRHHINNRTGKAMMEQACGLSNCVACRIFQLSVSVMRMAMMTGKDGMEVKMLMAI